MSGEMLAGSSSWFSRGILADLCRAVVPNHDLTQRAKMPKLRDLRT
jgi:hypothetical protein